MELTLVLRSVDFIPLQVLSRFINPCELSRFQIEVTNVVSVQSIVPQLMVLTQVGLKHQRWVMVIMLKADILVKMLLRVQKVAFQFWALDLLWLDQWSKQ